MLWEKLLKKMAVRSETASLSSRFIPGIALGILIPQAVRIVGTRSMLLASFTSSLCALILAGQRAMIGVRIPFS